MGPHYGSCVNTGAVPRVEKFASHLLAEATSKRCQKMRQEIRNQATSFSEKELLLIRGSKDVARSMDTLWRNSNLQHKKHFFSIPFVSCFASLHLAH